MGETGPRELTVRKQLVLLGAIALLLAGLFYWRWQAIRPPGPFLEDLKTSGVVLHVQLAGDLVTPGVYELPPGATLEDLLTAGEYRGDVTLLPDLWRAFPVVDGAMFEVFRGPGGEVEVQRRAMSGQALMLFFSRIDLNAAGAKDLEALPGVGEKTAEAIVRHREAHGPFRTVDDLLEVRGVGRRTVERLRALVKVGSSMD